MTHLSPGPSPAPPEWPHCGHGADPATDPVGCRGIHVPGHTACLAHLSEVDRTAYLVGLAPGADIDHRGTTFDEHLLVQLLSALSDDSYARRDEYASLAPPSLGAAWFGGATFTGDALFNGVTFTSIAQFREATFIGDARFDRVNFSGDVMFRGVTFAGDASFSGAIFSGDVLFHEAAFAGRAWFSEATFPGMAVFDQASFADDTHFGGAVFSSTAGFGGATFTGDARFDGATFSGDARFDWAKIDGGAQFKRAQIRGRAVFEHAQIGGSAWFDEAQVSGDAQFSEVGIGRHASFARAQIGGARFARAQVRGRAVFEHAQIDGDVVLERAQIDGRIVFGGAQISGDAQFDGMKTGGNAVFDGAQIGGNATFLRVVFERTAVVGPLVCEGTLDLSEAVFETAVTIEAAATAVRCQRTRWASTAALRLRYAELDLRDAVLEYPVTVAARPTPFSSSRETSLLEAVLSGLDVGVRLVSVSGVDAAHLVLQDIDLSVCRFVGAVHLDQLRVDGWCTFGSVPVGTGWYRRYPWRWSARRTLVEEHHWRARARHSSSSRTRGWTPPPEDVAVLQPAALAALYRQVRKSLEDGKNEPDAADFYYGEMEMRRHDTSRPRAERALLTAYWAVSGYGLRASRALAWLLGAMATTLLALLLWGLPAVDPKPTTTGRQVAVGQEVTLTTDTPDPVNPTGPWSERVTTERVEKALRVVINSVVFRSSGQDLTTAGTYTEMTSRITEPILLGLAVLAIRSRVKR
ncbi:pentapeptide repeat-containing protein [Streptomyces peucetius]|uniref:Pentapeptide repeat-containing protein n=1 Tax=Streptomyces peucetius TaxID=1950 RepID=A0ABY6IGQ5_STRPE|nr:pentapeptide repeat-containing protein [Streptomyces peucetius]UYQ65355.1 pentapeptide repeat-containing protein [Streptomyces peucetius]